jgi:hypothetical protein
MSYGQRGLVGGLEGGTIPIEAFDDVPDETCRIAEWIIYCMLKDGNQDVVRRMVENGCSVGIIGRNQVESDLPPHSHLRGMVGSDGRSYDEMCRGVGGVKGCPMCSAGQENLEMTDDEHYPKENILVHEFGHSVMNLGFDEDLLSRVQAAYDAAATVRDTGLYMFSNAEEFWANGTQAWFEAIARTDVNMGITTRDQLRELEPNLAPIMEEVYGDGDWRYRQDCPNPSLW